MTILTYLLTIILVVDCLFLGLLILVQLPKKEAGAGMAFGGGAADALFGAGSGTALSKLTSYAAGVFFALVFIISLLNTHARHSDVSDLKRVLQKESMTMPAMPAPSTVTTSQAPVMPLTIASNTSAAPGMMLATNLPAATNK